MNEKEAFKIVSEFIKKYYPFAQGKNWDKVNGNMLFMLGNHTLQEYIDSLADDEIDIEKYKKEVKQDE